MAVSCSQCNDVQPLYPLLFIIFVESTQDKSSESVVTSRQKRCNSVEFESLSDSDIWVKT